MSGSKNHVASPGGVIELSRRIRARELTPSDLVRRYLDRIEACEADVQAWVVVDRERAMAAAEAMTAEQADGRFRGPLHGIPVGIKDICDVAGLPTRCNSKSREDAPPATADSEIVAALRAAGAIVLGKTHTTEFAFYDPSPARNPYNLAHTPGGSSSGSGAAMAAGMVPAAVGTQTVASVNRPAAYCGIAAVKPSTRSYPTYGIATLSPVYDTPGVYAETVADAVRLFECVAPPHMAGQPGPGGKPRVLVLDDPILGEADDEVIAARDATRQRLAEAGHEVIDRTSPVSWDAMQVLQANTVAYEMARVLAPMLDLPPDRMGEKLREAIVAGGEIAYETYLAERHKLDEMRAVFFEGCGPDDVFLWPATPKTAPEGLAWTGDRRYIAPWTALGGSTITMPAGHGRGGLPIGMLLAGMPGCDRATNAHAVALADGA